MHPNIITKDDNTPGITFSSFSIPLVDRDKNRIHIVQTGGDIPNIYLRVLTIYVETKEIYSGLIDGFDYKITTGTVNLLSNGRILFTGGSSPIIYLSSYVLLPFGLSNTYYGLKITQINLFPNPVDIYKLI